MDMKNQIMNAGILKDKKKVSDQEDVTPKSPTANAHNSAPVHLAISPPPANWTNTLATRKLTDNEPATQPLKKLKISEDMKNQKRKAGILKDKKKVSGQKNATHKSPIANAHNSVPVHFGIQSPPANCAKRKLTDSSPATQQMEPLEKPTISEDMKAQMRKAGILRKDKKKVSNQTPSGKMNIN